MMSLADATVAEFALKIIFQPHEALEISLARTDKVDRM